MLKFCQDDSENSKEELSEKLKGHSVSEETRKKIGMSGIGREPWNKGLTKEDTPSLMGTSKKVSEWNKISMTDEKKEQISKTLKRLYAEGMKIPHSIDGYRKDLDMYFRSTWEANYARILKLENKEIIYEKNRFTLVKENGEINHVYIPDFQIGENEYVELKGHMDSLFSWGCNCKRCLRDKNKLELFRKQYPNIKLNVIGKKEYQEIYDKYYKIIPEWERAYRNDSSLKIRKQIKEKTMNIRVSMHLFDKPNCYFDDCTAIDLEELLDVGSSIEHQLSLVYKNATILVEDGWEYEFNGDELTFFNKKYMKYSEEELKKYFEEKGLDLSVVCLDKI